MSFNNAISTWFGRLRCIEGVVETNNHRSELDAKYQYRIIFSRYISPYGEYSLGFHHRLSLFSPPAFTDDTTAFETLYILIPPNIPVKSFLPTSDEFETLEASAINFKIEEIQKKVVVSYSYHSVVCTTKSLIEEYKEAEIDPCIYLGNSYFVLDDKMEALL
ncbi:MAG: hypothetical protein EOO18_06950 [Chryseobacterium sp.]|nr:MAG: hypothetical protein EOO18_06950 [Chryseobacterium sp.]